MKTMAASFDETLALEDQTFAGILEYREDELSLYDEYVRGFDDVPTLTDPVALPSRRLPPDFRTGERNDVRKRPREDRDAVRERETQELDALYREYADPTSSAQKSAAAARKPNPKRHDKNKRKRRSRRK